MAYCTTDELAGALGVRATAETLPQLTACVDAAAVEIDHYTDRHPEDPLDPADPLANRVNVARAVEWWKSNQAAWGVVGTQETGALHAPRDSFARHTYELVPHKQQWGVA